MARLLFYWKPVLEILILWFVYYRIIRFLEGTRAVQLVRGILILVIAFAAFQMMGLDTLNWILTRLFAISVVGILIVFQTELRQGLATLGKHQLFSAPLRGEELLDLVDKIVTAVCALASQKIGGLIAIERQDRLKTYVSTGVAMDSFVTSELIQSIFTPGNLLHDGGVVVQGSRIAAAACIFPITENPQFSRSFGMRHRSAIGLSEETDALVIVVSEETGKISLVKEGRVFPSLSKDELFQELKRALEPSKHKLWRR